MYSHTYLGVIRPCIEPFIVFKGRRHSQVTPGEIIHRNSSLSLPLTHLMGLQKIDILPLKWFPVGLRRPGCSVVLINSEIPCRDA